MDDFIPSNLNHARDEWCCRLISILSPLVIDGVTSIFKEAYQMCVDSKEISKYLMTFQNLLIRVPKWNSVIVEEECKRIIEKSGCNYINDLITCVHIIQLKVLTSVRVGNRQKKIDISIPKLETFIHKVYINIARKVYKNVYLFEKNIDPLQVQKNNRELEIMVQESILMTIRDSIPTEEIIRAYLDESVEEEEVVTIEKIEEPEADESDGDGDSVSTVADGGDGDAAAATEAGKLLTEEEASKEEIPAIQNISEEPVVTKLTFDNIDRMRDENNNEEEVDAPKSIEQLEKLSMDRELKSAASAASSSYYDDDDDDFERLKINEDILLTDFDSLDENGGGSSNKIATKEEEDIMLDFEEL